MFCIFNELDLLEIRLESLNSVVDFFVICEAPKTQSLISKPFYFDENKERFKKFKDKIIHLKMQEKDCPSNSGDLWAMENAQRNYLNNGLKQIPSLHIRDAVMISDLDEIPFSEPVKRYAELDEAAIAFEMYFCAYYINLVSPKKGWIGTVMTRAETLGVTEPQVLRNMKDYMPRTKEICGGHYSWLGGWEKAYTKLLSCIEPLDKNEVPNKEEFKKRFQERVKDRGRFHLTIDDDSVPLVVNNLFPLPQYLEDNKDVFNWFYEKFKFIVSL